MLSGPDGKLILLSSQKQEIIPLGGIRQGYVSTRNMLKSAPIRLAVNLCLIGALLLSQGGIFTAIASACEVTASGAAKCSGCGHCEVASMGERCGCCSKKRSQPAHEHTKAAKKSCCHSSPATPSANPLPQETEQQGFSACFCGLDSEPAVPASDGRVEIELLIKAAPKRTSLAIPVDLASANRASSRFLEPVPLLPRFSQRQFCIWIL